MPYSCSSCFLRFSVASKGLRARSDRLTLRQTRWWMPILSTDCRQSCLSRASTYPEVRVQQGRATYKQAAAYCTGDPAAIGPTSIAPTPTPATTPIAAPCTHSSTSFSNSLGGAPSTQTDFSSGARLFGRSFRKPDATLAAKDSIGEKGRAALSAFHGDAGTFHGATILAARHPPLGWPLASLGRPNTIPLVDSTRPPCFFAAAEMPVHLIGSQHLVTVRTWPFLVLLLFEARLEVELRSRGIRSRRGVRIHRVVKASKRVGEQAHPIAVPS